MKNNYLPWSIKIEDYFLQKTETDKIKFLLGFAVLAPSSHNSQPWRFRVSNRSIDIFADADRRLKDSDKNDRQLFISLGCAITNILIAADYYGLIGNTSYFPEKNGPRHAARIDFTFSNPRANTKNHLIFSIPRRVNNRNKYLARIPEREFITPIENLRTTNIQITLVSDPFIKDQLADVALAAGIFAMEDKYFRHELSRYIKSNITRSHVGMPAFGMGIPTFVSLFASRMIKFLNMNRLSFGTDERLLKDFTPLVGVISTASDASLDWVRTGEIYERVALEASRAGIATAVWASPIQIGDYYQEFKRILKTDFRPQMFFRIGYTDKITPHSPRIPVNQVLEHP